MSRTQVVLPALGLVFILGVEGASAAKLYVGAKQKYTTIQAAINAANTGDIVQVNPGTYMENLNFLGKAITVTSSSPTNPAVVAKTIINGGKAGSVVTFHSGETKTSILEGFTITNGSGYFYSTGDTEGGGVDCVGSSPIVRNNVITGNSAWEGGGVDCDNYMVVSNNVISGNSATYGGGVFCDKCDPTLAGDVISGNQASKDGGGIYCFSADPIVKNDVISGNSTSGHGGGLELQEFEGSLINDTISRNSAPAESGGGLDVSLSAPVLRNTIVADNTGGGGIVADQYSAPHITVTYSDVYGNTGGNYKGMEPPSAPGDISVPPRFANASKGNFYLDSKYGRWAPVRKTWVIDTVQSPCIDAGDPKSAFNLEPTPNGGRINMGAYGDTPQASKSPPTTAASPLTVSAAAVPTAGGSAQIVVTLASAASVEAVIVNIAGREIAVLPAQDLAAGVSTMLWDGRSTLGTKVPAGRYMVRVTARTPDGGQAQTVVALELRR